MEIDIITTEDGSHTLYVKELDEHYHSIRGAIQESIYVYITNGFHACTIPNPVIVEIGFGTGLNAFLTAIEASKNKQQVQYYSIEKYPLEPSVIQQLNYHHEIETSFSPLFYAIHNAKWNELIEVNEYFKLQKIHGDMISLPKIPNCDIVFFDAFAPSKQAELWTESIFSHVYNHMNSNGILVTYCAKGDVRRTMKKIGFEVERLPGPPGKWEMLRARKK